MHKVLVTLGAVAAWFLLGHFGLLAVLAYVWITAMTSTANTAKTRAVEQRVNAMAPTLGQVNQGIFTAVPGGTVTLTGGSVTLHCGALSQLDDETQTGFLATLSQCANPGGNLPDDPSTGSTWASGERGYINGVIDRVNNVLNSLQNHNFMAS